MKTYQSVKAQIDKLEKQAAALRKAEISKVVADLKKTIVEYGLSAKDLGLDGSRGRKVAAKRGRSLRASVGAAKYRNPETGATWTGRGRPPTWIGEAKDRETYLIAVPGAPSKRTEAAGRGKSVKAAAKKSRPRKATKAGAATAAAA